MAKGPHSKGGQAHQGPFSPDLRRMELLDPGVELGPCPQDTDPIVVYKLLGTINSILNT